MKKRFLEKLLGFIFIFMAAFMLYEVSAEAAVKLSKTKLELREGEKYRLKLKSAKSTVKWTSSNKNVATVSSKGTVIAKAEGSTTITATYKKKKYTCKVTVKPEGPNVNNILAIDIQGNEIDISTFAEAKITILNFWEPWCGWCIWEMPDLEKLYTNYKEKGLNIIGVFCDEYSYGISTVNDIGITYSILYDEEIAAMNKLGSFPFTMFVDSDGYIVEEVSGAMCYDEWEAIVLKYLK